MKIRKGEGLLGFFLSRFRAGDSVRQAHDKEILLGAARRWRKIFWSAKNPLPRERDSATSARQRKKT